jgi:hypothetical protein
MSALNAAAMLAAWEEGASHPPVSQAITMLSAAWPETPASDWKRLPIGVRDAALLDLQDCMFGQGLEAITSCAKCSAQVELNFTTAQIRSTGPSRDAVTVARDGYEVECRLPTSEDLLALPRSDPEAALLERCVMRAVRRGESISAQGLPPAVTQAVADELVKADPQAEVRVAIECPQCGYGWSQDFDITAYLWAELDDWARRLLRDVHALASAYGWSEREVLGMSARRRRLYLEMVGG